MSRSRNSRQGRRSGNFPKDPSSWLKGYNRTWKARCKAELRRDPESAAYPAQNKTQFGWYW